MRSATECAARPNAHSCPCRAGNFDWTYRTDHDFSLSPYGTNGTIKEFALQGQNASTVGHCLELETTAAAEADTRIWVFDGTNYRNVNDDFGGTHLSKARFWMLGDASGLDYVIKVRTFGAGAARYRMLGFSGYCDPWPRLRCPRGRAPKLRHCSPATVWSQY